MGEGDKLSLGNQCDSRGFQTNKKTVNPFIVQNGGLNLLDTSPRYHLNMIALLPDPPTRQMNIVDQSVFISESCWRKEPFVNDNLTGFSCDYRAKGEDGHSTLLLVGLKREEGREKDASRIGRAAEEQATTIERHRNSILAESFLDGTNGDRQRMSVTIEGDGHVNGEERKREREETL